MEKTQIIELESKFIAAVLASDVKVLDEYVAEDVTFLTNAGDLVEKEAYLLAHLNKLQKLEKFELNKFDLKIKDNFAIVTVIADVDGTFLGANITGEYRYLRVWQNNNNKFKLIAGAITKIV